MNRRGAEDAETDAEKKEEQRLWDYFSGISGIVKVLGGIRHWMGEGGLVRMRPSFMLRMWSEAGMRGNS